MREIPNVTWSAQANEHYTLVMTGGCVMVGRCVVVGGCLESDVIQRYRAYKYSPL